MTKGRPSISYGTVCSGHCAVTQAWAPLGFEPAFFAEIEAFPVGVLAHRFRAGRPRHLVDPETMGKEKAKWIANNREIERMAERGVFGNGTPNLGDFTKIDPSEWTHVEWLVGGTPCQSFSIAGARKGLKDHRGNLALAFIGLAHELAATGSLRGVVWENVPGVLSDKTNAFGCFLGALLGHDAPIVSPLKRGRWTDVGVAIGPAGRAAWGILDAQYFRLAQRRRRLFVVFSFGTGPDPVEILFERKGVPGAFAPGDRTGEVTPSTAPSGITAGFTDAGRSKKRGSTAQAFGGGLNCNPTDTCTAITAHPGGRYDLDNDTFVVAPTLNAGGHSRNPLDEPLVVEPVLFSAMPMNSGRDFTVREVATAQPVMAAGPVGGNQGAIMSPGPSRSPPRTTAAMQLRACPRPFGLSSDALDRSGEGAAGNAAERSGLGIHEELSPTVRAAHPNAVAFSLRGRDGENQIEPEAGDVAPAVRTGEGGSSKAFVAAAIDAVRWAVRRLTPRECERLQGTADDFTMIPWRGAPSEDCPDGPRYKVIGNSMAVDVLRWLGEQILKAEGRT